MSAELDIYNTHFGLRERPFSIQPDPDFLYWSPAHTRAYTMLEYGLLSKAPITLITGEVGAGKTTLLHHLLRSLPAGLRIGLIANAHGDRGELLRWVLMAFDQPTSPTDNYVDLFDRFQKYLISEYAAGSRVVLIFDEAQNMSRESLEELRMFTNINANKDQLLQLILVGQPELRDLMRRPDLRQFAQRVSSAFHLGTMDEASVAAYVTHRLSIAGGRPEIFTPDALSLIHRITGGVPRLVNQLCDLSLVYAYAAQKDAVTPEVIGQVLNDGAYFVANLSDEDALLTLAPAPVLTPIAAPVSAPASVLAPTTISNDPVKDPDNRLPYQLHKDLRIG